MRWNSTSRVAWALLIVLCLCLVDASAQQRRRNKRSRRITHPVSRVADTQANTSQAATPEVKIISTAEDQAGEQSGSQTTPTNNRKATRTRPATESDADSMRRTVDRLSSQVDQLTERLSQMQDQQRTLVNLERLSRAEQRAESLRAQLREVQTKESDLQARLEQVEYDLKPENIERQMAVFGTTRPEELREQRRRSLENERSRISTQLDQLATSRTRLESAIATADAEADRIRQLLDAPLNPPNTGANTTGTNTNTGTGTNTGNTEAPATSTEPSTTTPSTQTTTPSSPPF